MLGEIWLDQNQKLSQKHIFLPWPCCRLASYNTIPLALLVCGNATDPHQETAFAAREESNHVHIDFAEWKLKWKTSLTFYYSGDKQENSISM